MTRTLLVLTGEDGLELYFGAPKRMKEIRDDHVSEKRNRAFTAETKGPKLNIESLDVAWDLEDHVISGRNEGDGGVRELVLKALLIGAKNSKKIIAAVKKNEQLSR